MWARTEPATPAPTMMMSTAPSRLEDLHSPAAVVTFTARRVAPVSDEAQQFFRVKAKLRSAARLSTAHMIHPSTYRSTIATNLSATTTTVRCSLSLCFSFSLQFLSLLRWPQRGYGSREELCLRAWLKRREKFQEGKCLLYVDRGCWPWHGSFSCS